MQQAQGGQPPMGGQMDGQGFPGQDNNALLAQQQALMAMAGGGAPAGGGAGGLDAGASREALMNLLSRQGFGGGMGAAGMGAWAAACQECNKASVAWLDSKANSSAPFVASEEEAAAAVLLLVAVPEA